VRTLEGSLIANPKARFAILVSRFNHFITERLLDGCLDGFRRHGIEEGQLTQVRVPGSWEIPVVTKRLAESGDYAVVICLGAVIRGSTGHYDHIAGEAAKGMAQVALTTGVPVVNAVLTTDTIEQAIERAGAKMGNKGYEAACTAIEMANLLESV
jgi:6,7-dimethyl-8-ribityllumazine synthase